MNEWVKVAKEYVLARKKQFAIGGAIGLGAVLLIGLLVAVLIYNLPPKIVYQPTKACELFTQDEANKLMGVTAIHSNVQQPVASSNTAVSRCGYADGNADTTAMRVVAIMVRSGLNDKGVEQNRTDFRAAAKVGDQGIETVKAIGDEAFFNPVRGQLNVLKGRDWLILSYGTGASPESNTLEDVTALARYVVQ